MMAKRNKEVKVGSNAPVLGKRISTIISKTRKAREKGHPLDAMIHMTTYVCEVRSYLRLPEKKIRPFSSITRSSMYEKSDDVGAMAVAAAYRDIYGSDIYMIDGDRYGTEFFMPKTPEGVERWDNALLAISGDPDIKPKTIYDLMINSYAKACFASMAIVKETMEKNCKPMLDGVVKLTDSDVDIFPPTGDGKQFDTSNIDNDYAEVPFKEPKPSTPKVAVKNPNSLKERFKNAPKTKVDPAEKEHPSDDDPDDKKPAPTKSQEKVVKGSGEVDPKPGPAVSPAYTTQKSYSFSEAMKDLISFTSDDPEQDTGEETIATMVTEPNPAKVKYAEMVADIPSNNAQFHKIYPNLIWFTDLMGKSDILVSYQMIKFPFGDIIRVCSFLNDKKKEYPHINWTFIDPNMLYHDGYNVLTMDNPNGDILKEAACPMKEGFEAMIVKIIKGNLNKKERRNIMKMRPISTHKVFDLIDFTGLGSREPLETKEWTILIETLGDIIEKMGIKYRMKLTNYKGPENFALVCDESVVPLTTTDDALILIRPITEPSRMLHHCPSQYKDVNTKSFHLSDEGQWIQDEIQIDQK